MPKFKVFGGKVKDLAEERLRKIYFMLEETGEDFRLIAVNSRGERYPCGVILSITNHGELFLHTNVSHDIGLKLSGGKIQIIE